MKTWKSLLVIAAIVALGSCASARVVGIGVYFDEAATIDNATFNGGLGEIHTAYVCAKNVERMVAGASFKLELDPMIMLLTATYPEGLAVGDILTGVDLGLSNPIPAFFGDPALLCTLQLTTFDNLMDMAPLTITNHPNYDDPLVSDPLGNLMVVDGLTGYLTIPVSSESKSWGEVKSLYR